MSQLWKIDHNHQQKTHDPSRENQSGLGYHDPTKDKIQSTINEKNTHSLVRESIVQQRKSLMSQQRKNQQRTHNPIEKE